MKPINLNKARKARAKAKATAKADENSIRFGRTKDEEAKDRAETVAVKRLLDQAKKAPE